MITTYNLLYGHLYSNSSKILVTVTFLFFIIISFTIHQKYQMEIKKKKTELIFQYKYRRKPQTHTLPDNTLIMRMRAQKAEFSFLLLYVNKTIFCVIL